MPANKEQETRNTDDFGSEVQTDGMDVTSTNNRASTEAGAMRGMARSIQTVLVRQKQLFKFPGMKMMRRFPTPKAGAATTTTTPLPSSLSNIRIRVPKNIPKKLPKPRGGTASKSIPVRQAAKLSHGVSSGLDVPETKQQDSTQVSMRLSRALSFATSESVCACVIMRFMFMALKVETTIASCNTKYVVLYYCTPVVQTSRHCNSRVLFLLTKYCFSSEFLEYSHA